MKQPRITILLAALTLATTAVPGNSQQPATGALGIERAALPAPVGGFEGIPGGVFKDGRAFIAGQPDENALRRFRELGVTLVVNLRTPGEMNNRDQVPFDEAEFVPSQSMEYVSIPLGGKDHPYTPAAVANLAQALEAHGGQVLLHCASARRASNLWVAYLVLYQGFDLQAALDRGKAMAIDPPPLQGLLGRPLTFTYHR